MSILHTNTGRLLLQRWHTMSLARQFALAGSLVLATTMAVLGGWVAQTIKESATQNTAAATALYVNSFVEPNIQELAAGRQLSIRSQAALDNLFANTELGKRILSFKIWKEDGLVVYASHAEHIGKRFAPSDNLRQALTGVVTAEFDNLIDDENALEASSGVSLLEVYAPVRENNSDRIIAVAEFYAVADGLHDDIFRARFESWMLVALIALATFAALAGIVRRGSSTIERQQLALQTRVTNLSSLLSQNEELRRRVEDASNRAVKANEQFLRRVGAELHDGPAQLIGLALLRLNALKPDEPKADDLKPDVASGRSNKTGSISDAGPNQRTGEWEIVRAALTDSLTEIRNLSAGLALPAIDTVSLEEALRIAIKTHQQRTLTHVDTDFGQLPAFVPEPIKICIFRFVQEALNNAFRHAGGKGQLLTASAVGDRIEISVSDTGNGFDLAEAAKDQSHLGLVGLRERIESFGGILRIETALNKGTKLTALISAQSLEISNNG